MRAVAAALAGYCLALAAPGAAAQFAHDTVKIGVLADFSGVYRDVGGQGSLEAARLAVEEFGGSVAGHKIEIIYADGQNKPDVASTIARRWYDEEGVGLIVDLPASTVGSAVQDVARVYSATRHYLQAVKDAGTDDGPAVAARESKAPWDYYKILETIPGSEAFLPLAKSECPLLRP